MMLKSIKFPYKRVNVILIVVLAYVGLDLKSIIILKQIEQIV